jgi:Na+-driven multidrug efflux pump
LVVVGKQKFGSIVTWIGYPLIAFPLIYFNTQVRGMGLTGIWIGAIAGVSFNGISFITKACLIDWQEVCVEHAARREKENESIKKIDDEQASRVEQ